MNEYKGIKKEKDEEKELQANQIKKIIRGKNMMN